MTGEFTRATPLIHLYKSLPTDLGSFTLDVEVWNGDDIPSWCVDINGKYFALKYFTAKVLNRPVVSTGRRLPQVRTLCTLRADLSRLRGSLKRLTGPNGQYYRVDFEVVVRFGGTQLQATIQWKEGVRVEDQLQSVDSDPIQEARREGPITIVPNAIV